MTQGTPDYKYSAVDEIWDAAYNFGNMDNLQPVGVIDFSHYRTASAHLRLSNTGHGWETTTHPMQQSFMLPPTS